MAHEHLAPDARPARAPAARPPALARSVASGRAAIPGLQRAYGNAAVSRFFADRRPSAPAAPGRSVYRFEAPVHEAAERQGLTSDREGRPAAGGLTVEESSAVYFGNWMRDLNQVLVPMALELLPANAAFAALSYMAAKKFGRAMTPEQFGYYLPAEHIDSPAGLTNTDDVLPGQPAISSAPAPGAKARPGPYVTPSEDLDPATATVGGAGQPNLFAVDQTGTMAYIRRTNAHIERRLELAARSGRNPEGMLHFGAALHAVEDLFAHSNWIEIAVNRLLADDPKLLPSLRGARRRVFAYAAPQVVGSVTGGDAAGKPKTRTPLQTGSFTFSDTKISLSSELAKFLQTPLSAPASAAEAAVEQQFVTALLHTFEAQLGSNPAFKAGVRRVLQDNGVPGPLADGVLALPLSDIYRLTRIPMPAVIRDKVIVPVQAFIRGQLSAHILQPAGARLEAEAINAQVAGTSLIAGLREQRRRSTQQVADLDPAERAKAEAQASVTGQTPETVNKSAQAAAARHVAGVEATPERVVAGPSHSQLAKDHPNSPFFGLAFSLATEAVRRLRERMVQAWEEQGGSRPFDFDREQIPGVEGPPGAALSPRDRDRNLYHAGREQREAAAARSLERGNRIVAEGGDVHTEEGAEPGGGHGRFQPYDIAAMRKDSADAIRQAAAGLRAAAAAPGQAGGALSAISRTLALLDARDERVRRAREALDAAARGIQNRGASATASAGLVQLAAELDTHAAQVEGADTLAKRRAANAALAGARDRALHALAASPDGGSALAASILVILDDQIARTAPAFSAEQRAVLSGTDLADHTGPSGPLATTVIKPTDPTRTTDPNWSGGRRPPALVELIEQSRLILNHPEENRWWEETVRAYIRANAAQIMTDIQARNQGYATLWRPGEEQHGHAH